MFNLKKAMVAGATFVLAAGIIAPFGVSSVADAAAVGSFKYVEGVADDTITVSSGEYTVTTKIGSKESKAVYGANTTKIDISYLNGKAADITIEKDGATDKDIFKVEAQAKKVKGKFDPKTYTATLEVDGVKVAEEDTDARIGSATITDIATEGDLEDYTVKGATLYLSKKEVKLGNDSKDSKTNYTPASKEAKVKIPAKKNGPKITIDPKKFTFKLPKGCAYEASVNGYSKLVSESATSAKVFNVKDVVALLETKNGKNNDLQKYETQNKRQFTQVKQDITFEFYKLATDRVMESKKTEIVVPAQREESGDILASWEPTFNAKKTESTGILIKNTTQSAIEFMVVAGTTDLSKIDLAAKTTKWTTLAKNGSSKKIAAKKLNKDDILIVRVAGTKKNEKKNIEFSLASWISTSGAVIALPEKVKTDLGASLSTTGVTESSAVSQTAIGAPSNASDYTRLTYEIGDREVKVYEIGKAAPGTVFNKNSNDNIVGTKAGKWITVYAEKNGEVVAFKSMKVEQSHLK